MIVVYILVGILIGGLASYIFFNGKLNESKLAVGTLHTQLEAERAQHQKEIESLKDRFEHETELRNQQSSNEQQLRQKQFDQQLETIQEQFQNLASKILDQTTQKLKSENVESMSHITQPLKQDIELLQQAIDKTNHETARSTASLSEQLKSMAEQTAKIDASATRLTNVMRGANKVQGNWGELTLMNLLDSQGLRLGVDYDVQQTLSDDRGNVLTNEESGKRMIPDVILHYPNNEDIIIDSKMTIDAYANYMNAEDEIVKK